MTRPPAMARRMRQRLALWTAAALLAAPTLPASAIEPTSSPGGEPGLLCRNAIRQAEAGSGMPENLMSSIARVESGRRDAVTGRVHPWPWTINAEGRGTFFQSKAEAIVFAQQLRARGVESFDVGCMQVNVMYHPDAFQSLEQAFDPVENARYAAKFLAELKAKTGTWDMASAWYHSANPEQGAPYRNLVVAAMAEEAKVSTAYARLTEPARPLSFGGSFSMRSMPSRVGGYILLANVRGGMPSARSFTPAAAPASGGSMPGRGLDAYRMQPVAVARVRLIAAR